MPDVPALIGTMEAARRLGLSPTTVTRMVADGRIRAFGKLPYKNGSLVFSAADIDTAKRMLDASEQAAS